MTEKIGRCRLRQILRSRGIRQQQIADKLGMSKQQVNDYVNNRIVMSLETARRFAIALSCSIEDLYEWSSDSSSDDE
ncbi:helix-turn-helix transcriptional regulator [Brevibacillus fulvus]|uniref:Transcriptional regulator with XRE-family HTH domain n=1 Tax=Brevibacillus fulvus TaxID=1125967 RepID=A0A938XXC1_9BACL|nr:helix-turn-helix transcriptional regulator [Brevibacillus fulvus]MBM7592223.1 transcriptional regulator with XRE-family HTH domain [Brevibacillus fulvus]